VSFAVGADAYDRFMGRYSTRLAPVFADFAGIAPGQRVLDVGCGPGALTTELVERLGPDAVAAVDPTEAFAEAARDRHPGVDVRVARAEQLPYPDDHFDAALAQLVVHFMADPVQGLRDTARVTRSEGVVAACVWDLGSDEGPLGLFWAAARELEPRVEGESVLAGTREGQLAELFEAAELRDVEQTSLSIGFEHPSFEDWWEPFTFGVGPAGAHVGRLDEAGRDELRTRCAQLLAPASFEINASAWCVRARP